MTTSNERGSAGGRALVAQRGREYMRELGRKGARAWWAKYRLEPRGVNNFAIVERATGKVVNYTVPKG